MSLGGSPSGQGKIRREMGNKGSREQSTGSRVQGTGHRTRSQEQVQEQASRSGRDKAHRKNIEALNFSQGLDCIPSSSPCQDTRLWPPEQHPLTLGTTVPPTGDPGNETSPDSRSVWTQVNTVYNAQHVPLTTQINV